MRKKINIVFMAGLFICHISLLSQSAFADSPLTSTDFSVAYKDTKIVQLAGKSNGKLTNELIKYLINSKNPVDLKVALINKLSWDIDGKKNSRIFYDYLIEKKIIKKLENASADIMISYAYLKAMDNYFETSEASFYAGKAKEKNYKSYTISIINGLIKAQSAMNNDFCATYRLVNDVREDKSLKKDMRDEAIAIIFEYMDLYADDCN